MCGLGRHLGPSVLSLQVNTKSLPSRNVVLATYITCCCGRGEPEPTLFATATG